MKTNKGFSLVELIVVIAIMAIIAAVAVPVYNVYIDKANKAADQQLVSDIEKVINYAGTSGAFAEGEVISIILSPDSPFTSTEAGPDSALDKVLKEAFGEGYELQLEYDGWNTNGLFDELYGEMAMAIANSSYMTGSRVDNLLSDVEKMTSMATTLVDSMASAGGLISSTTLSGMFTTDEDGCAIDRTAATYGITKGDDETWEEWADKSAENATVYSNLLVLTAADEMEKSTLTAGTEDEYTMSGASSMILEFSSFYAFAATNSEFSAVLDDYLEHLNSEDGTIEGLAPVVDASSGSAWYNSLKNKADGLGYSDYEADAEKYEMDQLAFMSIMSSLGNPSEEQAGNIANGLNDANLFTEGIVNNMYNEYLDAVDVLDAIYAGDDTFGTLDISEGEIAILVIFKNGIVSITNSLPVA